MLWIDSYQPINCQPSMNPSSPAWSNNKYRRGLRMKRRRPKHSSRQTRSIRINPTQSFPQRPVNLNKASISLEYSIRIMGWCHKSSGYNSRPTGREPKDSHNWSRVLFPKCKLHPNKMIVRFRDPQWERQKGVIKVLIILFNWLPKWRQIIADSLAIKL